MSYWIYKIIHPLTLWMILAVWGLWSKANYAKYVRVITLLLYLVFSNPYLINRAIASREARYLPLNHIDSTQTHHILILGAGKNDDVRLWAHQRLSEQALARLVEGVKWAHRLPQATLIGSGPQGKGDYSQARHMA